MDILFFLLFLLYFIAIIVGLIKPTSVIRWGNPDKRNRKIVLKFYGIGLILFFVLFGLSINNIDATEEYSGTTNISENDDVQHANNNTKKEEEPFQPENENNEAEAIEEINDDTVVTGNLEVHFIDVGQADSILIKTGSDSMLIDAGNNDDSNIVVNYIKSQGINNLDYVIGTHPHEDHIGGLDAVINTFEISKILMPKQKSTTKTFEDVLTSIQNKGLKVTTPIVGETYNLGQAEWTILAPSQVQYDETNNASIAIKLEYGNNSFIFTGDAEEISELEMIKTGSLKSDVLKVGHHGSRSSTSIDFLNRVNPTYAVISVGLDNNYGHPHSEVIERLNNKNIEILRTDEVGTIIFISDGNNITYTTNKSDVTNVVAIPQPVTEESNIEDNVAAVEISKLDKKGELVTITNLSNEAVDMQGWKLVSVTGNQIFKFPQYSLNSGAFVTVGGYDSIDISDFDWEEGKGIWNNSKSDPAGLYDTNGNLVSEFND